MTNGQFESDTCIVLKKPDFFFGDAITEDDRVLYDGDYKWLRQIEDRRFFFPIWRGCPLNVSAAHIGTPHNGVGPI